jgi:hypothetical protein
MISRNSQKNRTRLASDIGGFTMIAMAKKTTKDHDRSPFWAIFARVDPELKPAWEMYAADFHEQHGQKAEIGAFIQSLLKAKLKSLGYYPPKPDATD